MVTPSSAPPFSVKVEREIVRGLDDDLPYRWYVPGDTRVVFECHHCHAERGYTLDEARAWVARLANALGMRVMAEGDAEG